MKRCFVLAVVALGLVFTDEFKFSSSSHAGFYSM